jgi:hypothetical protein
MHHHQAREALPFSEKALQNSKDDMLSNAFLLVIVNRLDRFGTSEERRSSETRAFSAPSSAGM